MTRSSLTWGSLFQESQNTAPTGKHKSVLCAGYGKVRWGDPVYYLVTVILETSDYDLQDGYLLFRKAGCLPLDVRKSKTLWVCHLLAFKSQAFLLLLPHTLPPEVAHKWQSQVTEQILFLVQCCKHRLSHILEFLHQENLQEAKQLFKA